MKIAIFGSGFVGNHLFNYLKSKNANVTLVSSNQLHYHDKGIFSKFLLDYKPNFVINCVGYTGHPNVDGCEDNKEIATFLNIMLPTMMSTVCESKGIKIIHVSSGCIFTGYEKVFDETDAPNFGLLNSESSFYSKTKHCFELATSCLENNTILRIRMPFTPTLENKNYLYKIFKYDNIISMRNSLTYIDDLIKFIVHLVYHNYSSGIFNVVNRAPVSAEEIVEIYKKNNIENKNWKIIPINELQTKANRSNCILTPDKAESLGYTFSDVYESMEKCIRDIKIALK